jgi:hypothetical protein
LEEVVPIETPEVLKHREQREGAAARRVFYYTSRFRQEAATERIRWHADAFHRHFDRLTRPGSSNPLFQHPPTSTLVADHPYFSGSGLGMGMTPNPTWGGYPLACDWFALARRRAVDMIGIEDWMGLQYMYGPNTTWEGFQLMGFQAAIFRSAAVPSPPGTVQGEGQLPIMAWITPSDETNLRLKTASALCQGAKHFFYWTYGPTATSTENYWSDLRGAYDGIAKATQQLAGAEHILAPGQLRKTRVALLYSISSDLWQPFGYVHMLERRGLYLSLVHDQYLVDLLSEEDIEADRLDNYAVLYTADPCIKQSAAARIERWVRAGGHLFGTCAAGSRNEFNEPSDELAGAFGIAPSVKTAVQPGQYHIRGALNGLPYLDEITGKPDATGHEPRDVGVIGTKVEFQATTGKVRATFRDGSPAVVENVVGQGQTLYVGGCPGVAYIKEANFVPDALKERWPAGVRSFLNRWARQSGAAPLVQLSHPVVEAGAYDAPSGIALVLANFTYEPIGDLSIRLAVPRAVQRVRSLEHGPLEFSLGPAAGQTKHPHVVSCRLPLGLTDIVLFE